MQHFKPRLWIQLKSYQRADLMRDVAAGLTVGIVALPLAMAFAIASGLQPQVGLFTAILAGFLISAFGGSSVQIGGPAGAFIVIVYGIIEHYGLGNLLISTMLAGVVLFLLGLFRLGAWIRYIPVSIVIGFTNGIAVLIGLSQIKDLLGLKISKMPADFFAQIHTLWLHIDTFNPLALAVGGACLAVIIYWPKSYQLKQAARWQQLLSWIPGTIVALVGATIVTALWQLPVETIGSRFGQIPQTLPSFAWPEVSWLGLKHLVIPTLTIALLGAIESLLCARVADNLIDLPKHDPNQELMAQGIANFVVPFFGGMPATGTIARTVTNIRAGARSPVAGIVHALTLLLVVLVAAAWAAYVPLAALAGILLFVAWNMGEWREFFRLKRFNPTYRIILLGTFLLTVVFDLTVAVEVGLVLACVFFIYRMSTLFRVEPVAASQAPPGVVVYKLYGALFFGAIQKVENLSEQIPLHDKVVVLEMEHMIAMDTTGLDALVQLNKALQRRDIRLFLCHLNAQPLGLIERVGLDHDLQKQQICADLPAALAASQLS